MLHGSWWRRNPHALPHWERALLAFYIGLLGLVMPFICWGAFAEPGHPHARPHLVFLDPVMAMPPTPTINHSSDLSTSPMAIPMGMEHAAQPAPSAPVGRSTPQLLIFSLLLLLVGALWQLMRIDIHYAILVCTALFVKPPRRNVPTPPPRLAA